MAIVIALATAIVQQTRLSLYYTVLYSTILYYTILYYTTLYYTILYYRSLSWESQGTPAKAGDVKTWLE